MNKEKANSYARLLVTFVVAVILVFTFGLVADGWQKANEGTDGESGKNPPSADDNEEKPGDDTEVGAVPEEPKYYNRLSGLICSKELAETNHISYTVHSNLPFYGISGCDMLIEFPMEEGRTRLLVFTNDFSRFGKIGTLAKTRNYITTIAESFGSILLSLGDDSTIVSAAFPHGTSHIDLSANDGYHYTEYTHYAYTNSSLLSSALANLGIDTHTTAKIALPYTFATDSPATAKDIRAERIYVPYSISEDTSFSYSGITKKYTYEKSGLPKKDNLTNEFITFDNLFVLFADSVTYEDRNGVTVKLETRKGGEGYYASGGAATEILWTSTDSGLQFTDKLGNPLVVNPGTAYIGYVKSSKTEDVKFS